MPGPTCKQRFLRGFFHKRAIDLQAAVIGHFKRHTDLGSPLLLGPIWPRGLCALIARAAKRSYIFGHAGEPALMLLALTLLQRCFMVCREALVDVTVAVMISVGSR